MTVVKSWPNLRPYQIAYAGVHQAVSECLLICQFLVRYCSFIEIPVIGSAHAPLNCQLKKFTSSLFFGLGIYSLFIVSKIVLGDTYQVTHFEDCVRLHDRQVGLYAVHSTGTLGMQQPLMLWIK